MQAATASCVPRHQAVSCAPSSTPTLMNSWSAAAARGPRGLILVSTAFAPCGRASESTRGPGLCMGAHAWERTHEGARMGAHACMVLQRARAGGPRRCSSSWRPPAGGARVRCVAMPAAHGGPWQLPHRFNIPLHKQAAHRDGLQAGKPLGLNGRGLLGRSRPILSRLAVRLPHLGDESLPGQILRLQRAGGCRAPLSRGVHEIGLVCGPLQPSARCGTSTFEGKAAGCCHGVARRALRRG
jgi:hypothetical protein